MGVTFHTSSNPRANLLSLPSALTAPHTGRAGRMLLAPASTFSQPDPASGPAGRAGGAGALAGQEETLQALPQLCGFSACHRTKQQFWGISGGCQQLSISWSCMAGAWEVPAWDGIYPQIFREHLPNIGVHTHTELLGSSRSLGPSRILWWAQGGARAGRDTEQAMLCCILREELPLWRAGSVLPARALPSGSWVTDLHDYSARICLWFRARGDP